MELSAQSWCGHGHCGRAGCVLGQCLEGEGEGGRSEPRDTDAEGTYQGACEESERKGQGIDLHSFVDCGLCNKEVVNSPTLMGWLWLKISSICHETDFFKLESEEG